MRGRLIFSFVAELHRSASVPTAPALFDPDFREPTLRDDDGDGLADRSREELDPVSVPCQVEPKSWDELQLTPAGDSPKTNIALVFHFADLERLGLVDDQTGQALIQPGDRLGALREKRGDLVQSIPNPPGLFVTEARSSGFGLNRGNPRRNLLFARFEARPTAARRR